MDETLIVSITSWHKRINNVKKVLETILNQTVLPDRIIVNLCTEDFPHLEESLPKDLVDYIEDNPLIEIYWFIENYKAWKKHLHALDVAGCNDLILCIDDDHLYPKDFIEKMYASYVFYDKKFPVTLNKIMLCHNLWTFNGPGTLYRKSDWGDYKKYLTYDVLHKCYEDIFITILFAINDMMIMPEIYHMPTDEEMLYNDVAVFSDPKGASRNNESHSPIHSMISTTLDAMEDSLKKFYFKNNPSTFVPSFWEILKKLIDKKKVEYPNPKPAMKYVFDMFYQNYLKPNVYDVPYKELCLDLCFQAAGEDFVPSANKTIITISSWPGRIKNVSGVLSTIYTNIVQPDTIILNLAYPDFGFDKEPSYDEYKNILPEELVKMIDLKDNLLVHWYDDSELKSWKKHLFVLEYASENDKIICIDDDILYAPTFIDTMIKSYELYNEEYPVTSITENFCQGSFAFCGHSTIYSTKFFKGYKKYLNENIIHMFPEDNHLLNILLLNGHLIMPVIGRDYLFSSMSYNETFSNFGNGQFDKAWWDNYNKIMAEAEVIINKECKDRPEMAANWRPACFNFSYANTKKFLETKREEFKEYPKNLVFDCIEKHFIERFGNCKSAEISHLIDSVKL